MKTTTTCILSGFFGALFAFACGVVDKEANANSVSLIKQVYEYDCVEGDCPGFPDEIADFSTYPIYEIYYECDSGDISRYINWSTVHCDDEGDFKVKKIITFIK